MSARQVGMLGGDVKTPVFDVHSAPWAETFQRAGKVAMFTLNATVGQQAIVSHMANLADHLVEVIFVGSVQFGPGGKAPGSYMVFEGFQRGFPASDALSMVGLPEYSRSTRWRMGKAVNGLFTPDAASLEILAYMDHRTNEYVIGTRETGAGYLQRQR